MKKALLESCRQGNMFAQRQLVELYSNRLYRLCLRYMRNEFDAEEVLMNGFLRFFETLHSFEYRDDNGLEAWLKRIMVNAALMYLRKTKNLSLLMHEEDVIIPENATVESQLNSEMIYSLILQLPTGYRTVFNLYVIEGYSHAEIAEQLGISENTSKSQLSRARALLQSWLIKQGYEHTTRRY
ncbi:sigma-70 family RNA polymerase sigma factor [Cytophagaceae bacterium DM2B3-1]|uniref:Sigma-70 family RNA polymerase sigma factor n=1 Tax=Xanthocytophaga flava TaxID=3048013 RepID=A0ABT7CVG3_9BACT|nr:sigma-70 family RNA polymerase sigma factor [Xanthocytophaga flavus]MDJ1471443.1 sigma-70 family RNA polymerase sigma factor [Xanthocytophaga flavus]MDJ1496925.1 sigma-70 family RNA polymerase sigma factor [Xanthocytophaga flavus]